MLRTHFRHATYSGHSIAMALSLGRLRGLWRSTFAYPVCVCGLRLLSAAVEPV